MLYFRNPFTRLDFRPAAGTFGRFAVCQAEEEYRCPTRQNCRPR